jgi:hypothetical protein
MFNIFLSLHTFSFLMAHPIESGKRCAYAEELAKWIISECRTAWGTEFIVYTVHALLHIPSEVRRFGKLETFGCFWGENFLQFIGKYCRGPNFCLQQVVKRVCERDVTIGALPRQQKFLDSITELGGECAIPSDVPKGVIVQAAYKCVTVATLQTKISILKPDCFVLFIPRVVARVSAILKTAGGIMVLYQFYQDAEKLYDDTINSAEVGIFTVRNLSTYKRMVPLSDIACKMMVLSLRGKHFALPILHTCCG